MRHFPNAIVFFTISLTLIFGSCARTGSDTSARDVEGEDGVFTEADSDSVTPAEPEKPAPLHFSSAAQALDFMHRSGNWERYSTGIIPEMAEYNLDYASRLLDNKFSRFIIVDKATMQVLLYDKYGNLERKYGMACARNYGTKHRRADSRTPEGFFTAEGIYDSTDWLFTDDNGHTSPAKGSFGPRFIRLKCPNTSQIGIHGTASPWSIGHRASHGCIRITNENILELVKLVEVGMPIIVSPGPRDMYVNQSEGYVIPSVAIVPGGSRAVASKSVPGHGQKKDTTTKTDSDTVEAHHDTHAPESSAVPAPASVPEKPAPDPLPSEPQQ